MDVTELLQRLWMATLALTGAIVLVAALRTRWQRLFGAEHACRLWWLPPLAVLVSQLPHAAAPALVVHVPTVLALFTVAPEDAGASVSTGANGRDLLALAWVSGVLICLWLAGRRQLRFTRRLRGAAAVPAGAGLPPLLRAADTRTGPALVGAWRPRIVLPSDFQDRYEAGERDLILAHEATHAARLDGMASGCGTLLQAMFWFHPLAWWALPRFRRDQELACDAVVMRTHPRQQRNYALAMLKTQVAGHALPVGCPWLSRHPFKERIDMLKLPMPDRRRRATGYVAVAVIALGVSAAAYAARQEPRTYRPSTTVYQLAMSLHRGDEVIATSAVCAKANQPAVIEQAGAQGGQAWRFALQAKPLDGGRVQVSIDGSVGDATGGAIRLHPVLRGTLGSPMSVDVDTAEGQAPLRLVLVPTLGCAAAHDASSASHVSMRVEKMPARAAAEAVAARAGLRLVNPQALDDGGLVEGNFEGVPPQAALAVIADTAGVEPVFEGTSVRFRAPRE